MSNCSIGFEFELSNVLLLESSRFNNIDRGDGHLDSTPGFFLPLCLDEEFTELTGFSVLKGYNKVKFDHDSGLISERLEFESKPIYVINLKNSDDEFKKFIRGIVMMLNELKGSEEKLMKYFNREFGSDNTRRSINYFNDKDFFPQYPQKNEIIMREDNDRIIRIKNDRWGQRKIRRAKKSNILNVAGVLNPELTEGTVQVTYGIPLSRYKQLLSITPFKSSVPRLEELFRQTFIGLLKVKSQIIDTGDVTPVFYYSGEPAPRGEVSFLKFLEGQNWDERSKVTYVFDIRDVGVSSDLADLLNVMNQPNSNLYNFLFLIHNYMNVLGFVYKVNKNGDLQPVVNYTLRGNNSGDMNTGLKGTLPLMLRNKFSDIYEQLLSSEEKKLFIEYTRVVRTVDTAMVDIKRKYNLSENTLLIAGFLDRNGYSYLPMGVRVPMIDEAITFDDGVDRNHHIIDYKLWLLSISSPLQTRILWRTKYFERMLQKGLLSYAYPKISEEEIRALKLNRSRIKDLYLYKELAPGYQEEIRALKRDFEAFSSEWARSSIKQPDADLLSPVSAYASVISVVGDGRYAMGAYPINEYDQVLFECRQCISGQKTLGQFQRVGRRLVQKFVSEVCSVNNLTLGKRGGSGRGRGRDRVKKSRNFEFPKKKRAPKKSRKPKRRSVKKSRKPKRRSVKKSRKPKRRSVKKSRKPKRRSVKKSRKPKRRSVKRKVSRKRRSVKRKVSRKRRSVKKSPKRRSRKNN